MLIFSICFSAKFLAGQVRKKKPEEPNLRATNNNWQLKLNLHYRVETNYFYAIGSRRHRNSPKFLKSPILYYLSPTPRPFAYRLVDFQSYRYAWHYFGICN